MMRSKELKTSRSILVLVLWFSLCTVLAISVWRCSNCIQRKQLQSLWPRMSLQVDSSHMIVLQDAILGMVHYYFNILRSAPNQDPHQVAESTSKNPWEHREHMYIQITRVELQHLLPPQTHRESISIQITREICFSISCICWFWFGFCVCRTSFPTWLKIKRNRISVSTNLKFCSSGPIMTITTAVQTNLPVCLKNHTDSMTAIFKSFWEWYLWCGCCMGIFFCIASLVTVLVYLPCNQLMELLLTSTTPTDILHPSEHTPAIHLDYHTSITPPSASSVHLHRLIAYLTSCLILSGKAMGRHQKTVRLQGNCATVVETCLLEAAFVECEAIWLSFQWKSRAC